MLGKLSVPGRPTSLDDSRARAYCACRRCGWGFVWTFFLSLLGRDRPNHFGLLSLVVYIMGSGQVSDLLGGNKTLPPP